MIPLSKPVFIEDMKEAAIQAMENEFYVMGESVYKFEEEFAKYCGTKYAISVNSGTSALQLSVLALNIKNNIYTSPMSFITTANSIVYSGATPLFSDIESNTGNINMNLIDHNKCSLLIPVHLCGNLCDIEKLMELKESGVTIIEDACQAHGAEYRGIKAGSFGDVGCFSFYSTKDITVCGDGGMIVTNDEELAKKLRSLRDCGRKSRYEHDMIGYTFRLNTINAAIGRVQLKHLDSWNSNRKRIADIYRRSLPKEILLDTKLDSEYHLFVIKHKKRDTIIEHLKNNSIEAGIHYPIPIHLQPIYRKLFGFKGGEFPIAEDFSKKILSIPIFSEMTIDEAKIVVEKINEGL